MQTCKNCDYCFKVVGHPWNKEFKDFKKTYGYACSIFHEIDEKHKVMFMDSDKGACEMFEIKEELENAKNEKEQIKCG